MKLLIPALLLLMTTSIFSQTPPIEAGVSQTLSKWRAANYGNVRYKLNLTLEKTSPTLKGTIEVSLKNNADRIVLDWRKIRGKEDASTVSNVSVNGKAAKFEEINEHLVFTENVAVGENVVKLDFTSPIATSGAAVTRYVDKEDSAEYVYSLFVPSDASTAFPVFDQPDLKARFQLNLEVPAIWEAVSNTKYLVGGAFNLKDKDRKKSFRFMETQPISTYVFAFAAGHFDEFVEGYNEAIRKLPLSKWTDEKVNEVFDPKKQKIYVRKSQAEKFKPHAAETFRLNREAVKYLEGYFDYKFPFPKYDLVLIPEFPFGGMEHAGATFLRESSIIFPSEPTANDFVSRANLIFHEAAHQWFGDTVTMRWFDDLWLKEGFAEFMAYKTLEKVLPEYNAWKAFYERNKPLAYLTDSTKGTTPIYQEIPNLSAAKSAYGNIVYRKAPSFLRQAEFYLGEDKFQTAVRTFLKKHEYANAEWKDLVNEFAEVKVAEIKKGEYYQKLSGGDKVALENFTRWSVNDEWAKFWVEKRGTAIYKITSEVFKEDILPQGFKLSLVTHGGHTAFHHTFSQEGIIKDENYNWLQDVKILKVYEKGNREVETAKIGARKYAALPDAERKWFEEQKKSREREYKIEIEKSRDIPEETEESRRKLFEEAQRKNQRANKILYVFPNYQDYGYGIFLLDERSRDYVLKNIQDEKDDFLRSMMWGTLWDSVREAELAPADYVELAVKNVGAERDELTIQTILNRVGTAMNYYLSEAQSRALAAPLENLLIERMRSAPTLGQRITFYRAFLNTASSENARAVLKEVLSGKSPIKDLRLKTKDKFDIVTKLLILGDQDAPQLLAELEKTETADEAKRYAYAARAGTATAENKAKFWSDFTANKEISESWIEAAFAPFNSPRHSELTLPYLERALAELPNLKRSRKIFFVNGWLGAFVGGQKSERAQAIVNKFLTDNPNLDKDLRLKILENADVIERAVKIRAKYAKN